VLTVVEDGRQARYGLLVTPLSTSSVNRHEPLRRIAQPGPIDMIMGLPLAIASPVALDQNLFSEVDFGH
jgi:hypothetical protein